MENNIQPTSSNPRQLPSLPVLPASMKSETTGDEVAGQPSNPANEPKPDTIVPDTATSIIVPNLPLSGNPFGHNWAIPEDAGTYNPPSAPNLEPSPQITSQQWDAILAREPPIVRLMYHKRDFIYFEGPGAAGCAIRRPDLIKQVDDRYRDDLRGVEFEKLPEPAVRDKGLGLRTHYFEGRRKEYLPLQQWGLLTEEMEEDMILNSLGTKTERAGTGLLKKK